MRKVDTGILLGEPMWSLKLYSSSRVGKVVPPLQGVKTFQNAALSVMSMLLVICIGRRVYECGIRLWYCKWSADIVDELLWFLYIHVQVVVYRVER